MNMTLALAPLALVAMASTAVASQTTCADPTATVTYSSYTYDGGAPPPPAAVTSTESAKIDGVSLGTNQYSEQNGWNVVFKAGFVDTTRVILKTTDDQNRNLRIVTYAVELALSGGGAPRPFDGLVICTESDFLIPPP